MRAVELVKFKLLANSTFTGQRAVKSPIISEFNFSNSENNELAKKLASSLFTSIKGELDNILASSLFSGT